MQSAILAIKALAQNWKSLLTLFCLGGTVTVLGVIPGTEPVRDRAIEKIEDVKATFISPTTVE